MEKFIKQLAETHFDADRQAFINFIRKSFALNGDEITDIYNEVWIDVIDNVRRGRTEQVKNWKTYVFSLGWKRAYKLVTRRTEMQSIDIEDSYPMDYEAECLRRLNEDAEHLQSLEKIEIMMIELEAMPKKHKELLTLYYLKGKSTAEVAEAIGYSGDVCCNVATQLD